MSRWLRTRGSEVRILPGAPFLYFINQLILYKRVKKIQFDNEIKEFVDIGYKVALLFGFLILAIYFYSIHFYPALSVSAFFSSLLIVALLGISLSAIFIFPVAYAPWMWSSIFKKRDLTEFIVGCEDAAFVIQALGLSHRFANSFKFIQLRLSSCCSSQGRMSLSYRQIYGIYNSGYTFPPRNPVNYLFIHKTCYNHKNKAFFRGNRHAESIIKTGSKTRRQQERT